MGLDFFPFKHTTTTMKIEKGLRPPGGCLLLMVLLFVELDSFAIKMGPHSIASNRAFARRTGTCVNYDFLQTANQQRGDIVILISTNRILHCCPNARFSYLFIFVFCAKCLNWMVVHRILPHGTQERGGGEVLMKNEENSCTVLICVTQRYLRFVGSLR